MAMWDPVPGVVKVDTRSTSQHLNIDPPLQEKAQWSVNASRAGRYGVHLAVPPLKGSGWVRAAHHSLGNWHKNILYLLELNKEECSQVYVGCQPLDRKEQNVFLRNETLSA